MRQWLHTNFLNIVSLFPGQVIHFCHLTDLRTYIAGYACYMTMAPSQPVVCWALIASELLLLKKTEQVWKKVVWISDCYQYFCI
jgi:hypothetical protein